MKPNPIKSLLNSRKFLLMIGDLVAATVTTLLTGVVAPEKLMAILGLLALWQPVIIALILAIMSEDNAERDRTASMASDALYAAERVDWKAKEEAKKAVTPLSESATNIGG